MVASVSVVQPEEGGLLDLGDGSEVEAVRWFERNRAACAAPGLFTGEYDVHQRQLRGNYPQSFVHALLIESASRLAGPGR